MSNLLWGAYCSFLLFLGLLKAFSEVCEGVPIKSGLMLGLDGEKEEVLDVLKDLRAHNVEMLTLGQYLQPTAYHLPVKRYVTPTEFDEYKVLAEEMGFKQVVSGTIVRSSCYADLQAAGEFGS